MKGKSSKSRSTSRARAPKKVAKQLSGAKVSRTDFSVNFIPGEIILAQSDIVAFTGRQTVELIVANTGDRPIQVGSHCHFFEANRALRFDREKAYGFRLQVPAGTAVRFEPGEDKRVTLVSIGGNRVAYGINGLVNGRLDDPNVRAKAMTAAREAGYIAKEKAR
jgi:urease beta subunit